MQDENVIDGPVLTFPEEVSALYSDARVILEYGSGGSTVMASELTGKTIFPVESESGWSRMMQACFSPEHSTDRNSETIHEIVLNSVV